MIYFKDCHTITAIMSRYNTLAQIFHPNKGGSSELMAKLNAELPIICNHVLSVDEAATGETQEGMDLVAQFCRVIGRIVQLPGIRFKLVGNELYASGNTYPVRQDLRGAGMSFSPKKQAWFIRFDAPGAMSLGSYVSSQK